MARGAVLRDLLRQGYVWKPVGGRTGPPNILKPNTGINGGGTASQWQGRLWRPIFGASSVRALSMEFANYYNGASQLAVDPHPLDCTLRVGIQFPSGRREGLTFKDSGSRSTILTSAAATNAYRALTTPLPVELDQANPFVYSIEFGSYTSVPGSWCASTTNRARGDEPIEYGTALVDKTTGTTNWFSGDDGRGVTLMHNLWGLVPKSVFIPSVAVLGDSISTTGNNDSTHGSYIGWTQRCFGNYCAMAQIGASGMGLFSLFQSNTERARHIGAYISQRSITHLICCMGGNDVKNGVTQASFKISADKLVALLKPLGAKLILCTFTPLTDPTNTTEQPAFPGTWQLRRDINGWIRTDPYKWGFLDASLQVEDPSNPDIWLTGAGLTIPADGTHPGAPYHQLIVDYVTPLLPAILAP